MNTFRIEATRGSLAESVHQVSAAVVDPAGLLLGWTGEPRLVTFWRSAAKPFQTMPLLEDGAADRYGLDDAELAIATSSHSSEPFHLAVVDGFLHKVGVREDQLACGPHPPLGPEVAERVVREGIVMTPRWSNCSGKHTGMLALTQHHGWSPRGYQLAGHPTQHRLLAEVAKWSGVPADRVTLAVDGCTTVCYALPLAGMATAYARFAVDPNPSARRLWGAATSHPELIAGTGRLCTQLMALWPGEIFAKVGADGVYCAAIPSCRVGIAIKVHDGDFRAVGVALVSVVRQVLERLGRTEEAARLTALRDHAEPPVRNTRGEPTGVLRAVGRLEFLPA